MDCAKFLDIQQNLEKEEARLKTIRSNIDPAQSLNWRNLRNLDRSLAIIYHYGYNKTYSIYLKPEEQLK